MILIFSFMIISCLARSQDFISISTLNGIWHNASDIVNYKIFKNGNVLSISYNPDIKEEPFYISKIIQCGFVDPYDSTFTLKREGIIGNDLFSINGGHYHFYYESDTEGNASLELESINPTNVFNYTKVVSFPKEYIKNLFLRGKIDNKDYLKEFLNKYFKEITRTKTIIYSNINKKTQVYLLRNDLVEVLEEKGDWLKIRYYGKKTIEGWIKRSDVE